MPTLIDSPSFTANEVYEIQATDPVEGAAAGASYGGIGVSNQPHQQLANRTAYLYGRQQTNIANIAALQAFTGLFKGLMGANGYLAIPYQDVNRGQLVAYVQWGQYSIGTDLVSDSPYQVAWPIAFPNGCVWAGAFLANPAAATKYGQCVMETVSYTATSGTFFLDWDGSTTGSSKQPGFYWIAIGF